VADTFRPVMTPLSEEVTTVRRVLWLLLGCSFLALFAKEYPAIVRYIKIERM